MTTIAPQDSLAEETVRAVSTTAAVDAGLATTDSDRLRAEGWDSAIDRYLVEWGNNPGLLEDDGLISPSPAVIGRACQVAIRCRDKGLTAPLRVVPDGEGGISFERRDGDLFESLNVRADGNVELLVFSDCTLVTRRFL